MLKLLILCTMTLERQEYFNVYNHTLFKYKTQVKYYIYSTC
jgi:hypothetical protein